MSCKFVVLRSLSSGDVCWSACGTDRNPERMADGTIGYEIIAYADSAEDAQRIWADKSVFGGLLRK